VQTTSTWKSFLRNSPALDGIHFVVRATHDRAQTPRRLHKRIRFSGRESYTDKLRDRLSDALIGLNAIRKLRWAQAQAHSGRSWLGEGLWVRYSTIIGFAGFG
jgi:hypothetical protein